MIDGIKAFSNSIRLNIGYARFENERDPEGESFSFLPIHMKDGYYISKYYIFL